MSDDPRMGKARDWPMYSSVHRLFDLPRDVVYDLVLATIQARAIPGRLLAESRARGLIDIRVPSSGLGRAARVTVSVAALDRRTTEVSIETPVRAMPRLRARADDARFAPLLDAIDDAARASGFSPSRSQGDLSLPA